MRTLIAMLKIILTLATVLFTNIDATIHILAPLKENKNTTTYTDMDAANNTEIMFHMRVYIVRALFFG